MPLTAEAGAPGDPAATSTVMANPRAERVRAVRRLAEAAGRRRAGAFLAEGPQAVREALVDAGRRDRHPGAPGVREVFLTAGASGRHPELERLAEAAGVLVRTTTDEVLAAMADTSTPQGVLAVCDLRPASLADVMPADVLSAGGRAAGPRGPSLVAVLARAADPGNAGTVLRTADAAGASALVLTAGSVDAAAPKLVRAAAGSTFHLDVVQGPELADVVTAARRAGLLVLAADGGARAGAADLDDLVDDAARGAGPLPGAVAWVFGNEAHGLTGAERELSDLVVRVPLHGRAESLNLAAAAAVCLYASARAQRRGPAGGPAGAGAGAARPVGAAW